MVYIYMEEEYEGNKNTCDALPVELLRTKRGYVVIWRLVGWVVVMLVVLALRCSAELDRGAWSCAVPSSDQHWLGFARTVRTAHPPTVKPYQTGLRCFSGRGGPYSGEQGPGTCSVADQRQDEERAYISCEKRE